MVTPSIARGKTKTPSEQLTSILKGWSVPKPSPYYSLKVYDVLADVAELPAIAEPLLPMLASTSRAKSIALAHNGKLSGGTEGNGTEHLPAIRNTARPMDPDSALDLC